MIATSTPRQPFSGESKRFAPLTLRKAPHIGLTCVQIGPNGLSQGAWEATLLGRDINRNAVAATYDSAVYLYDTTLGVPWLRNANAGSF